MGRIGEKWRNVLDIGFYITLIICLRFVILSLTRATPLTDENMSSIVGPLLISAAWFTYRSKYSSMILALLALASGIYLYSYSLQYPPFESIYSDFYLQRNDLVEFQDFYSELIFNEKGTILVMTMDFVVDKSINETSSIMEFGPPRSAKYYSINVGGLVDREVGSTWGTFPVVLFAENGSIVNNTSPELRRLKVPLERGRYKAEIIYKLPKMDPYVRLRMQIRGDIPQNIEYIHSSVYFSDMFYECIDPCLVPHSRNTTANPPYVQKSRWDGEDAPTKPTTSYSVSGDDVAEVYYDIRASGKWAVVIRNLMLSIIAGLIVALATTWRPYHINPK